MRQASSEHNTLGGRVTSSRRQSRKSSRNTRSGGRRRLATSSKTCHVMESPDVTSSGTYRGPPAVTSSSGNPQEARDVLSSGIPHAPRGRTSCKYSRHCHHRTESPTVTSSGKSQELPRGVSQSLQFSSSKTDSLSNPDHRCYVRSISVPPGPATMSTNPFSPFWNFMFKDKRTTSSCGEDDDEGHVCNTVRRPSNTWFGSSAVITNVYLSTVNRWTGVWPTAASHLATSSDRKQTINDGLVEYNGVVTSRNESQVYDYRNMRQVRMLHFKVAGFCCACISVA